MESIAVILAGGSGTRFSESVNKSFAPLGQGLVIEHILQTYDSHKEIDGIIIVVKKDLLEYCRQVLAGSNLSKIIKIVEGGSDRQESTKIGLNACTEYNPNKVLIQEAVRPFTSAKIITDTVNMLESKVGTVALSPLVDAVMVINSDREVVEIPEKSILGNGQSPEGFVFEYILRAHEMAEDENLHGMPENCELILRYGLGSIGIVEGIRENFKITHPIDMVIANEYLKQFDA